MTPSGRKSGAAGGAREATTLAAAPWAAPGPGAMMCNRSVPASDSSHLPTTTEAPTALARPTHRL
eukprot:15435100-Alexandrium_andersonii.AAC.1